VLLRAVLLGRTDWVRRNRPLPLSRPCIVHRCRSRNSCRRRRRGPASGSRRRFGHRNGWTARASQGGPMTGRFRSLARTRGIPVRAPMEAPERRSRTHPKQGQWSSRCACEPSCSQGGRRTATRATEHIATNPSARRHTQPSYPGSRSAPHHNCLATLHQAVPPSLPWPFSGAGIKHGDCTPPPVVAHATIPRMTAWREVGPGRRWRSTHESIEISCFDAVGRSGWAAVSRRLAGAFAVGSRPEKRSQRPMATQQMEQAPGVDRPGGASAASPGVGGA
jgi:hypothetical protein